jgi:hypothetical protein
VRKLFILNTDFINKFYIKMKMKHYFLLILSLIIIHCIEEIQGEFNQVNIDDIDISEAYYSEAGVVNQPTNPHLPEYHRRQDYVNTDAQEMKHMQGNKGQGGGHPGMEAGHGQKRVHDGGHPGMQGFNDDEFKRNGGHGGQRGHGRMHPGMQGGMRGYDEDMYGGGNGMNGGMRMPGHGMNHGMQGGMNTGQQGIII